MDQSTLNSVNPRFIPTPSVRSAETRSPKRGNAARMFGYDVFISFALGSPPRGTQSYASDLARRLRERDFTVFFSEDEAPPGEQLDGALRTALHRAKTLVVIANRGTLEEPRWVRTEVEEFTRLDPARPVIAISVGGALQDPTLADQVRQWLRFEEKIWLDERAENVEQGIASEELVERLALAPRRFKSNVGWRWVVRSVIGLLTVLAVGLALATKKANDSASRARAELKRAVSVRLIAEAQAMMTRTRNEGDERALQHLIAAHRLAPGPEAEAGMLTGVLHFRALRKLIQSDAPISCVTFSADDRQIISVDRNYRNARGPIGVGNNVRRWDVQSGLGIGDPWHLNGYELVNVSRAGGPIVLIHQDNTGQIWNAETRLPIGAPLKDYKQHPNDAIALSPDDRRIVAVDYSGQLHVWDTGSGERIGPINAQKQSSSDTPVFNRDGSRFISEGDDHRLQMWDAQTLQPLNTFVENDRGQIYSLAFSPDGTRIVSGGSEGRASSGEKDGILRLWDVQTGKPIGEPLTGHEQGVNTVAFSNDGAIIASGSFDGTVRLWDGKTGAPIGGSLIGHQDSVNSVAFNSDGSLVVSGSSDDTIRVWSTTAVNSIDRLLPSQGDISAVAISPDGTRVVSGSSDLNGTLYLWDGTTNRKLGNEKEHHSNMVSRVAFFPDGTRIVSGSTDGTLRLWDAQTGRAIGKPMGPSGSVTDIAVSPDGRRIASTGYVFTPQRRTEHELWLWDATTGEPIPMPWGARVSRATSIAFGRDNCCLLVNETDTTLRFRDMQTGEFRGPVFRGLTWGTYSLTISPNGDRIAAGSSDGIQIWDAKTGEPMGALRTEHTGMVMVAFTSGGQHLVSGSGDGTLRFWDTTTGQPIGVPLQGHQKEVSSVAATTDGRWIVSGSGDGTLRLWPGPKVWPALLCAKLTRNMSRKEWREWVSPEIDYEVQCAELPIPPEVQDRNSNH